MNKIRKLFCKICAYIYENTKMIKHVDGVLVATYEGFIIADKDKFKLLCIPKIIEF